MKIGILATLMCVMPSLVMGATRDDAARVGVNRMSNAAARMPTLSAYSGANASVSVPVEDMKPVATEKPEVDDRPIGEDSEKPAVAENCREAYRACMDEFCLLDESEGYRCACSSNIEKSKDLIQEIQKFKKKQIGYIQRG
ncbi:MAG: hypothetical protein J6L70_01665 [Alphaproteobacteria bacterium]|nr:hypothetical protein [Alphaproteobacteria bacterium]